MLAQLIRGQLMESSHRGSIAITKGSGALLASLGEVESLIYPRSTVKPFQAAAMVGLGLDLDGELLALAAASHSGESFHRDAVHRITAEHRLLNTPGLPLGEQARHQWLAEGLGPERVAHNCSGKHAAMVRTCDLAGLDPTGYLDVDHPLQVEIGESIRRHLGMAEEVSVDGCGAPLFAVTLTGLARGFGRLAVAESGGLARVARAYRRYPRWMSGTGRIDETLQQCLPGIVSKEGAEGVLGIGLPDGMGIAIKIEDGNQRALLPVAAALLRSLGFERANQHLTTPVLGGGKPVGRVEASLEVQALLGPT